VRGCCRRNYVQIQKSEKLFENGTNSLIRNVYKGETAAMHSLFIGQTLTLFGEPDYWTEDYENIFSCVVSAEHNGNIIFLDVYHGAGGPAIGGPTGGEAEQAADELAEIIVSAEPTDYEWEGVYEDVGVTIKMGVKDGEPYYESEMPEESEELWG